jgi:tRNA(Ser,Leu) C12 N-acetylase TAN1
MAKRDTMKDWNVVVSVCEGRFAEACTFLKEYGAVRKTDFFNVVVMRVDDIHEVLEALEGLTARNAEELSFISRLVPVTHTFSFQTPEEFEAKAKKTVLTWVPALQGKSFHVRMHRRGFKGRLSSVNEEHLLDDCLLSALDKAGSPGRIVFENPDAIVVIETVGPRAGCSFWKGEDMDRYPFLRLD